MNNPKRISVFGSSLPQPGEPAYEQARKLGRYLAEAGFEVINGGYAGTMEAVSRGAAEAGGHVIGITCEEIEAWRPGKANHWVKEEWRVPTLHDRLHAIVTQCDAAIALPGGIGTLAEIVVMWSQMQTQAIPARPLVLIGSGWRTTFDALFTSQGDYIRPPFRALLSFAPDVARGFQHIQRAVRGEAG